LQFSGSGDEAATAQDTAEDAGLTYVNDSEPGILRKKAGHGFRYKRPGGAWLDDPRALKRIRALAIPPAWTDVWICASANGHIQATGRDARQRKQYRYHPEFRALRETAKFDRLMTFVKSLPAIRQKIAEHMDAKGLGREKILATVVHLLETTLIRIGNDDYVKQNQSYGLTTLRNRHVEVNGAELRFNFKGKSGKIWRLRVTDRRIAKIVRACQDIPGQELFQYLGDDGNPRSVTSSEVNAYLKDISGKDITAKDFRTWAGTLLAALALREFEEFDSDAGAKRNVRAAIERVASRLGNTPTICRKCYIHPEILNCYVEGSLLINVKQKIETQLRKTLPRLRPEEAAVLALLKARLKRTLDKAEKDRRTSLN
jgi:DNA topoisomerase I